MKKRYIGNDIIPHLILFIGAVIMIVPFLWMILTAFKSVSESTQLNPFIIIPSVWRFDAFKSVITKMNFFRLYWNTLIHSYFYYSFLKQISSIFCTIFSALFS